MRRHLSRALALLALTLGPAAWASAPMPPTPEPPPKLPITRHAVQVRCAELEEMGAPLSCEVVIELELAEPVPALQQLSVRVGRSAKAQTLSPTLTTPSGLSLRYETRVSITPMAFTAAVRDISPVEARHPIFTDRWMATTYPLIYEARALHGAPMELELELPEALRTESSWLWLGAEDAGEGRRVVRERYDEPHVYLSLVEHARVALGGPVFGIGCPIKTAPESVAREDDEAFQTCPTATLGWEFSAPDWLLYGLRVESDFETHAALIASVEAMAWIENFGVGLLMGVPLELAPDSRIGVRAQLTFSTWVFGAAIGVDVFPIPALNKRGGVLTTLLQAHVSF